MKTDELITALARGAGPAPSGRIARRLGGALAAGLGLSVVLTMATLGLNPGLRTPDPWLLVKFGFVALLMLGFGLQTARLARPLPRPSAGRWIVAGTVAAMALAAGAVWQAAGAGLRADLFWGHSWSTCPVLVAALSVPALLALLAALRRLAPTRPGWAGFSAGATAGAAGAAGYALFCTESSPLFVLSWYSVGMAVPATVGALVGPRLLRW